MCEREREEFTLFHLLYSRDKINKVKSNISFFGEMLRYPQTDSAMKMNFKFFNRQIHERKEYSLDLFVKTEKKKRNYQQFEEKNFHTRRKCKNV